MDTMTRTLIRTIRSQHAHTQRQTLIDAGELQVCAGCNGDHDQYTIGCKRCWDRKRRRARRDDPGFLERERQRQQNRRAARAEAQRARREREAESVSLPSRPAGSSREVGSQAKSPVGRRSLPVQCKSATNRQREER